MVMRADRRRAMMMEGDGDDNDREGADVAFKEWE